MAFFHFWLIKYQVRMYCDLLTTCWLVDCLFGLLLLLVLARSSAGETAQSSKLEWGRDAPLALRRRVVKILCFLLFLYFTTCMLLGDENTVSRPSHVYVAVLPQTLNWGQATRGAFQQCFWPGSAALLLTVHERCIPWFVLGQLLQCWKCPGLMMNF